LGGARFGGFALFTPPFLVGVQEISPIVPSRTGRWRRERKNLVTSIGCGRNACAGLRHRIISKAKKPTKGPHFLQIVAKPKPAARRESELKLTGVAFKVSRLMEFCSERMTNTLRRALESVGWSDGPGPS
jgi:hypothetical protein